MKIGLTIDYHAQKLTLTAHDLLTLALQLIREKYDLLLNKRGHIQGVYTGQIFSPHTLKPKPLNWLKAAMELKQGADKNKKLEVKRNHAELEGHLKQDVLQFYKTKLSELSKENINPATQPIWAFAADSIKAAVAQLPSLTQSRWDIFLAKIIEDLKYINTYLKEVEHGFFRDLPSVSLKFGMPMPPPFTIFDFNKSIFLKKYLQIYFSAITDLLLQSYRSTLVSFLKNVLTVDDYMRLLHGSGQQEQFNFINNGIEDFKTQVEKFLSERKLVIFCKDVRKALLQILAWLEQKLIIPPVQGEMSYLAKAALLSNIIEAVPWQMRNNINNINKALTDNYSQQKGEACINYDLQKEAVKLAHKRMDLYKSYNVLLYVRQLEEKAKYPFKVKNETDKLRAYIKLINSINEGDEKFCINGPANFFTFMKLLIKQGYHIQSIDNVALAGLIDSFLKKDSSRFLTCEDICMEHSDTFDKFQGRSIRFDEKSTEFYQLGNRVVGAENYAERYIYDYGSVQATQAQRVMQIRQQLSEIKVKMNNYFKIAPSLQACWIYFLTLTIGYSRQVSQQPKDFFQCYESLKQEVFESLANIADLSDQKIYLEILACRFIENIADNFIFDLQGNIYVMSPGEKIEIPEGHQFIRKTDGTLIKLKHAAIVLQPDTQIVTYPQLYRALKAIPIAEVASDMRKILKGELTDQCESRKGVVVLTAIWFLAETSRNPLTMLTTLMMLDMMELSLPYGVNKPYTLENVLWHPLTVAIDGMSAEDRLKAYTQYEAWGGKHPMCHPESYRRSFEQGPWPVPGTVLEFVRQKEASVIINWLYHYFRQHHPDLNPLCINLKEKNKQENLSRVDDNGAQLNYSFQSYKVENIDTPHPLKQKFIEDYIKPLLSKRFESFDKMEAM